MSEAEPGRLIASGRAADVFDLGNGTVLRRYRSEHDSAIEGRLMAWLAERNVAVPPVHRVDGRDIVMDRIDGPTMLEDLQRAPWRLWSQAKTLGALQQSINSLDAPDWLPAHPDAGDGNTVVHGDLHPMNVILGDDGPVMIDFSNACRGPSAFDAALSYVLMSTSDVSNLQDRVGQRFLVGAFRHHRGRSTIREGLAAACRYRLADVNVTDDERQRIEDLARTAA